MLARVAADLYWMGRYIERTEHTARLLKYQLTGLVDSPADELALGWQVIYRALGQSPPMAPADVDEAEAFMMADAYTLAGSLVEDHTNPDSMVTCWGMARENATQLRPQLPLEVWTTLNRGFLWIRDCDFPGAWKKRPATLVSEGIDRLRLLAGVVEATMSRDNTWRFMQLGRFVERFQHQTNLLCTWDQLGAPAGADPSLSWSDLLRVCVAFELYCRRQGMTAERDIVLEFLIRDPEVPRSLRFAVQRIEQMLVGIDPLGSRHPLVPPRRVALRLAATVEAATGLVPDGERTEAADNRIADRLFAQLAGDGRRLHDLLVAEYVDYPVSEGLPS
ncbi:MAG: alpha-E domain-containing protein [Gemmatimonadota bacterium]|nr:alpha-E domain-containing protein [Gemmatimonadota bacterium]